MRRAVYGEDHESFRSMVRDFAENEVAPHLPRWREAGRVDRSLFATAGRLGLLGMSVDEAYGGGGVDDVRYDTVLIEELCRVGAAAVAMNLSGFNDLVAPYLTALGTEEQKQRWLPGLCAGELVGALAMTEPGTGSDLAAIRTTARADGDELVIDGAKTFISNGILADLVVTVVTTDPAAGRGGISLVLLPADSPGFRRGAPLHKIGLHAQDTAELFFDGVRVPADHLLGAAGGGMAALRHNLAQERLSVAVIAMASMRRTFDATVAYTRERTAFGRQIAAFQANTFTLAEMATEIEIAQTYVDRSIGALSARELGDVDAAMAKWWVTELQQRVVTRCLQLHGGYGYMAEYAVAGDFLDARAGTLYAGTTEIMKEIIGRSIVGRPPAVPFA